MVTETNFQNPLKQRLISNNAVITITEISKATFYITKEHLYVAYYGKWNMKLYQNKKTIIVNTVVNTHY